MSDKEYQDLNRKLDEGLQIAHQRMLEEKALRDETVVVANSEGKIEYISAKEVLASF
ncbi:MAG: histidine kinase [Prevotella sp.]|nr:histidine kinase [Prevotella sp.]